MDSSILSSNPMLGSQLVSKSLLKSPVKQRQPNSSSSTSTKCQAKTTNNNINQHSSSSPLPAAEKLQQEKLQLDTRDDRENNNISNINNMSPSKLNNQDVSMSIQQSTENGLQQQQVAELAAGSAFVLSAKEFEQINKESQELKSKTRRLQLEVDEKNEIINVLRDELETTKEQNDKFERENLHLLKDSNRVKFLQDENDFLQDKVGSVEKLELEIKRLKERLSELDFLKLRIRELEEDRQRAQDDICMFEEKLKRAEAKLTRVAELEAELDKWKMFSHDLELERNQVQTKLLESIEQETKLNIINKKVEDEIKRLRVLIKSFEEQRDEEQASTSLIISVADLKQMDQQSKLMNNNNNNNPQQQYSDSTELENPSQEAVSSNNSSIKFELDKQLEKELADENRDLKQRLCEHESKFNQLIETSGAIRDELSANRKLISELRQDLACEKSLNAKLTNQLASFTKQIKNLDKHYFPMHDSSVSSTTSTQQVVSNSTLSTNRKLAERASTKREREENESSPSNVIMTASAAAHLLSKQTDEVLLCEFDQRKINDQQTANNSEARKIDNETALRQPLNSSSKLSAMLEKSTKNHSLEDSSLKPTSIEGSIKQREIEKPRENVRTKKEVVDATLEQQQSQLLPTKHLTEPLSVVTNKSTDTHENSNKDKAESNSKWFLLSETSHTNKNDDTATVATSNSSSTTRQALDTKLQQISVECLPTPSTSTTEDKLKLKKNLAYNAIGNASNNNSNNRSNICTKVTSASPVSGACSPSSSPPPAENTVTIQHDSGFRSINNDFNQFSPNGLDSCYSLSPSNSSTLEEKSAEVKNAEEVGKEEHSLPAQTNRSKVVIGQDLVVKETGALEKPLKTISSYAVDSVPPPPPPTQVSAKVPRTTKEINPLFINKTEGSQKVAQRKAIQSQNSTFSKSANYKLPSSSSVSHQDIEARKSSAQFTDSQQKSIALQLESSSTNANDDVEVVDADFNDGNNTSAKTSSKSGKSQSNNRHFVRNSLPSRSVNFGHSRPSGYLDRIRASVTATTTTSTTSSFNEQTKSNLMVSKQQTQHQQHQQQHQQMVSPYFLNCLLEHQHTEKCFISHVRPSQVVPSNLGDIRAARSSPIQSSRQLNALIDPVSHQHLMMNAIYQNHSLPHHAAFPAQVAGAYGLPEDHELTEQQIMHLASLQQQHYYHHLQHMHQLHQMHHLHLQHHHMHQKCEQLKRKQQVSSANCDMKKGQPMENCSHLSRQQQPVSNDSNLNSQANHRRLSEPIYSGGSQFYAPSPAQVDQVYVNIAASDSTYMANESQSNRTRLVNSSNSNSSNANNMQHPGMVTLRSSPNRPRVSSVHKNQQHQQVTQYTLPQIDEVNGLPKMESTLANHHNHQSQCTHEKYLVNSQRILHNNNTDVDLESKKSSPTTNQAPSSSSSPTSSTSSHLSPSSASSSSSLNSLSASSVPLNRSALRHSTTDFNRRQFSVERESVSSIPMTATLSRVGSCRVKSLRQDITQMKFNSSTAQSQQSSLKSSKMLNINQQPGQQVSAKNARVTTAASSSTYTAAGASDNAANNGKKSSVWFEYGCV